MGKFVAALFLMALAPAIAIADASDGMSQNDCATRIGPMFGIMVVKFDAGPPASLIIREKYWNQIDFAQKQEFAEIVDCAVAGEGKAIPMVYRSDMTNKPIAHWSGLRLTID
mgnify:CR=1 FL=1